MHWILQDNVFGEEGWDSLVENLARFDIPFSCHKVVPFVGELIPEPTIPDGENVIVMGSYSMSLYADKRNWTPGSFANARHDFRYQLWHWGNHMVNVNAVISPLDRVREQKLPFFIRPVNDTKSFPGTVMDWEQYCEWRDRIFALMPEDNPTITPDTIVMVCPLVKIYREYRLWVVDGEIVTASLYKEGTRVRYDSQVEDQVLEFGSQFVGIDKWQPARAYCLDIFDTEHGLKIGEVNNINSAGFYKADMQKLVHALNSMSFEKRNKMSDVVQVILRDEANGRLIANVDARPDVKVGNWITLKDSETTEKQWLVTHVGEYTRPKGTIPRGWGMTDI